MALKLIEMTIGKDAEPFAVETLKEESVLEIWSHRLTNGMRVIRLLVLGREVEAVLDLLSEKYGDLEEFRVVVLAVEATLPRIAANGGVITDSHGRIYETIRGNRPDRVSREELYVAVGDAASPSNTFLALVVLSALVAAAGVLRDNMAIVIGAMVIAPLLGPSIALALGTTLGDMSLIRPALKANILGMGLTYMSALILGILLSALDVAWPTSLKTTLTFTDVVLALASGSAGVLGFTGRVSSALVGVMVAVALAPPLVTSGLLAGMGQYSQSLSMLLLFLTNLISVNLAAVVTFIAQGIRPGRWDETARANTAVRASIIVWMFFLLALLMFIVYWQKADFLRI